MRKARRRKGGQALRPPLNAHVGQSGLQETFWYHQVVSDEETPTLDQIPGVERQLRRNGTLSTSALGTDAWTVHCRDTSTSPARVEAVRCPNKYTTMNNTTTKEYGVEWYGKTISNLSAKSPSFPFRYLLHKKSVLLLVFSFRFLSLFLRFVQTLEKRSLCWAAAAATCKKERKR